LPVNCGQHFLHFVGDSIVPRKAQGQFAGRFAFLSG
jgi:hypothetical protein